MAGRALGVLLAVAVAALLVAADDDKGWKCLRSCAKNCHHHNDIVVNGSATVPDSGSGDAKAKVVSAAVSAECKSGCHDDECFKDLPPISSHQCAIATCLSHPHQSKKKTACFKDCCDKCFRDSPPAPGPRPPAPGPRPPAPAPGPSPPGPPEPGPSPPGPPEPSPPEPPGPGPTPPSPPK